MSPTLRRRPLLGWRIRRAVLQALVLHAVLVVLASGRARGEPDTPKPSSATATTTPSAEELELARYLTVLENLEVLEDLELLELMPLLEEGSDDR